MRLTLRTLLAYLDDLLKPAEAREIGRRLSESGGAGAMAERIRDVLRRRRIAAPPVDGQPDANIVAEYLDNLLPDADVETHERTCLSSDEALAETAAAHQILSLAMGKPAQVSDSIREKALVVCPEDPSASEPSSADSQSSAADENLAAPPSRPQTESPESHVASATSGRNDVQTVLARDSERSWTRWAAGAIACIAGVVIFALLFSTDDAFRPTQRTAIVEVDRSKLVTPNDTDSSEENTAEPVASAQPNDPAADNTSTTETTTTAPVVVASAPKSGSTPATPSGDPKTPATTAKPNMTEAGSAVATTDTKPPTDTTATAPETPTGPSMPAGPSTTDPKPATASKPATEGDVTDTSVAMTKATPPDVPTPPGPNPDTEQPPAVPLMESVEWQQSGEGLALHLDPIIEGWTTLPPRSKLFADERLVIPEPFESTLRTDAGPLAIRILSNTDVHLLPPTPDTRGGLEIVAGRLVIKSMGDEADSENVPLMLQLGDKFVRAEIGAGAELAVDVQPTPPDKIRPGQTIQFVNAVTVMKGPVSLDLVPPGGASNDTDAAPAKDGSATGPRVVAVDKTLEVSPFEATPEWAIDSEPSTLTRRYGTMFRNMLPDEQPLVPELTAILNEPTYRMSELAAATLTMLKNAPGLVAALGSVHEETRRQAIKGLRRWLAYDPSRTKELATLLATRYRSETVDVLVELLEGYSIDDLRRPSVSNELVSHLEDSEIAVREVAFFDLERMTDRTFDYQPNGNSQSRGVAVRRWRDYVARDGALLTPVIEDDAE